MTSIIPPPAPPDRTPGFRLPRNVLVLGGISLLNDTASEMIYPLLPIFLTQTLGASAASLGLIEGVAESAVSLFKLFSGYLSDRLHRRKIWIGVGYAVSNAVRPLIALAGSWPAVLALRFADRIGKGLRTSPRDALVAESVPPEHRGRAFGFHRAMDHLGAVIGPLLAALILWRLPDRLRLIFFLSAIPGAL
ncbi:MAG TPA: MFS transporter, partial [Elusimicrobiota bacterium]|nr:MFS transporter [Elusimicrobiota bacterium]